jgi:hypothetical protein
MRKTIFALGLLCLLPSCGGDGTTTPTPSAPPAPIIPQAARTMESAFKSSLARVMPQAANIQGSLVFVLNPGTGLSQGVALTPDASLGASPYAYFIDGTFDGNGDGFKETRMTGRAVFPADPATTWTSVSGQMNTDVSIPVIGHIYHASIDYTVTSAQSTLSGTGTFTNPLTGATTTLTVAQGAALVIKPATDAADAKANACGHSIQGTAQVAVASSEGTYRTTADFSASSPTIGLRGTTFVDSTGQSSSLPDSTTDLNCGGGSASLADWVATYDVSWACLPRESGQYRTTIAVNGTSTLAVTDQGETSSYAASLVGASPHAVRGFTIDGPVGSRYREDFNWTLLKSGDFTEFSSYRFFEGFFTGSGGICASSAHRIP